MRKKELLNRLGQNFPHLSVGTLTADLMRLQDAIDLLEASAVRMLHIDVMDGLVWPRLTVGSFYVRGLKTVLLKDVHLLVDKPDRHIVEMMDAGADIISFSLEYCADAQAALGKIRQHPRGEDVLAGLSLNPSTSIQSILPFAEFLDLVVLLTIGPDTGKKHFFAELPLRIKQIRALKRDLLIFVDGAVNKENISQIVTMGPDVIVTGSAIFDGKEPHRNLQFMLQAIQSKQNKGE